MPVSYDILLENIMDPSHVPFAHHGIQGNRNKPTRPQISVQGPITAAGAPAPPLPTTPKGPLAVALAKFVLNSWLGQLARTAGWA